MRLHIRHHTQYRYHSPVVSSHHIAILHPRDAAGQRIVSHRLTVDPTPAYQTQEVDVYGNRRTLFAIDRPHTALEVVAESVVDTQAPEQPQTDEPWEQVRDRLRYRAGSPYRPEAEFVYPSPHIPREALIDPDLIAYARASFPPGGGWLAGCRDLTARLHADLAYAPASTEVHTPLLAAFRQRRGVCQDFAHVLIAALRALGLPARYVSGYLLTQPPPGQPRLVGADASHAWVGVPWGERWFDLDPTNRRWGCDRPDEGYVTVATGRDYGDVSPLRGVIQGGGAHALRVAVTVAPPQEWAALDWAAPGAG